MHPNPELPLSFGAAAANIEEVPTNQNPVQEPKARHVVIDIQETMGKNFSDLTRNCVSIQKQEQVHLHTL